MPPYNTFVLPIRWREGPIIMPDMTPPGIQPASSPLLKGMLVIRLCAGMNWISTFMQAVGGIAIMSCAILG